MDTIVRIGGRGEFQAALRAALAEAASAGWRELWLCDPDFAQWPLGETAVVESLTQWVGPQRRLTLLALHYEDVLRRHPRWDRWRRQWLHVVHCRAVHDLAADDVPTIFHACDALTLRLFDRRRYSGTASRLAADGVEARRVIDALSQRSSEAFPATLAGL